MGRMAEGFMTNWRQHWGDSGFRAQLLLTIPALVLVLYALATFLAFVESRPGISLPDPLLALYPAKDVTWLTFGVIYLGLVAGLVNLLRFPAHLLLALQSYIAMALFRIIAMYCVPLDPPQGMILLRDPLVEILGTGRVLTKDLFFSGHTATMVLLALTAPQRRLRVAFLVLAACVAVLVLWQHVHYSIDVFVAPFFAYAAYRIVVLAHPSADLS